MTPFSYRSYSTAPIVVDGYEVPAGSNRPPSTTKSSRVSLDDRIPLVAGREFTRADNETSPLVAVVDETMAAQFWRGVDPIAVACR